MTSRCNIDGGHLDSSIRPFEASDRKEMVALLLQDHSASRTKLIPILRVEGGAFANLRPLPVLDFGGAEGCYLRQCDSFELHFKSVVIRVVPEK